MIYSSQLFSVLLVSVASIGHAFRILPPTTPIHNQLNSRKNQFLSDSSSSSRRYAVPEWLVDGPMKSSGDEDMGLITVRFVNTVSGKDVVTQVEPGSNLLMAGDNCGVKLPRACRTGLCGSCTCEIKDPEAISTATNPRDGYATIRACSTKCFVPQGMDEMVIDVYRMQNRAVEKETVSAGGGAASGGAGYTDPMARFSGTSESNVSSSPHLYATISHQYKRLVYVGNWEKEFRPQWELEKSQLALMGGQVGVASDPRNKVLSCSTPCQESLTLLSFFLVYPCIRNLLFLCMGYDVS